MRDKLARWLDEYILAGKGLLLATRDRRFWLPFFLAFFIFGTLLNLLSNGFSSFQLMAVSGFSGALKILSNAFLAIFGVGKTFGDWALNFVLILFQSILITLVVFVARHNRQEKKQKSVTSDGANAKTSAALIAGLAVLGSGCPTCGTTLLAPVLGAIASGSASAMAFAGKLSIVLNGIAIIFAILVFRKLGLQTYAIIKSEQFEKKKESHAKSR